MCPPCCSSLKCLAISRCRLSRGGLAAISPWTSLTALHLPSSQLEWLPQGPYLQGLEVCVLVFRCSLAVVGCLLRNSRMPECLSASLPPPPPRPGAFH